MKKNIFALLIILALANFLLVFVILGDSEDDTAGKTIDLEIDKVTLYPAQALLQSTVQVNISPGDTSLTFRGLPEKIDTQSIRIATESNLTVSDIHFQVRRLKDKNSDKTKTLEDSLVFFEDSLARLNISSNALKNEQEMILTNKSSGANLQTADKLKEIADFYRNRYTEIQSELLKNDKSTQKIKNKIVEINTVLDKLAQKSGELTVKLSAFEPDKANLTISYLVKEAGWKPVYDLKAKNTDSLLHILYRANVYQHTGKDWKNVKLTLSSGNPNQNFTKPELKTQYIDILNDSLWDKPKTEKQEKTTETKEEDKIPKKDEAGNLIYTTPNTKKEEKKAEDKTKNSNDDYGKTAEIEKEKDNEAITPEVSSNMLIQEFEIAKTHTIYSGKRGQLIEIQTIQLKADFVYQVIPKLDKAAFLSVMIPNWKNQKILSGKMNLYFEGTFVGEKEIDTQNQNDTLELSLGRNRKITTQRKEISDSTTQTNKYGWISNEKAYQIQVVNPYKKEIKLLVEEQIPVSKNKKIEVKLLEAQDAQLDKESGKITWLLKLKAGEAQRLTLRYKITCPIGENPVYR